MTWNWRIGALAGIDVYLHATFLILPLSLVLAAAAGGTGIVELATALLLLGCLFAIIVLHELGHALTARRFGIGTKDILLLPIGGVARLERIPEAPTQELLIALAGPAVNVVLAGFFLATTAAVTWTGARMGETWNTDILAQLFWINVALAVFNMLPAFPMDGGRVLRALLAYRIRYATATRVAARIGQGMAVLFGIVGLLLQPMLVLVAVFVWFAAQQEILQIQRRAAVRDLPSYPAHLMERMRATPWDSLPLPVVWVRVVHVEPPRHLDGPPWVPRRDW